MFLKFSHHSNIMMGSFKNIHLKKHNKKKNNKSFKELDLPLLDNTEFIRLKNNIISNVHDVGRGLSQICEIKRYEPSFNHKHELLFFIKPEITGVDNHVNISSVLDIIFDIFKEYNVFIEGVSVIGADYLKKYNLIADHYSVINRIAKQGVTALTEDALQRFKKVYGIDPKNPGNNIEILGGFQFLEKYKDFNPESLESLWDNSGFKKIASGTFVTKLKLFDKDIYLLNGFFPFRLKHYTSKGNSIIVFIISSNVDWKTLRDKMLGSTDPEKAYSGSIRRIFFEFKDKLNIKNVDTGFNCVHMSAGPIEALSEIIRFASRHDKDIILKPDETMIGKRFIDEGFSIAELEYFMSNPEIVYEGKLTSVFELTEENNIEHAIDKLKEIKKR